MKTKHSNPTTKISQYLSGHIEERKGRCGKLKCKCVRGQQHTSYYRVWYKGGWRFRKYVRKSDLEWTMTACSAFREIVHQHRLAEIKHRQIRSHLSEIRREKREKKEIEGKKLQQL